MYIKYLDKQYRVCDNGTIRVQIGKHDKLGQPRYKTHLVCGIDRMQYAVDVFYRIGLVKGVTIRLSYNVSRNAPYKHLDRRRTYE
jgi:hypothetical protein